MLEVVDEMSGLALWRTMRMKYGRSQGVRVRPAEIGEGRE